MSDLTWQRIIQLEEDAADFRKQIDSLTKERDYWKQSSANNEAAYLNVIAERDRLRAAVGKMCSALEEISAEHNQLGLEDFTSDTFWEGRSRDVLQRELISDIKKARAALDAAGKELEA